MTDLIPRDFIQQLLNRIDLVEMIDARIPLRKKTGANFFACCPFHQEKSPSFSVSQNKQFYYCFGCGAHGNAIDFLMQYDRLSFPEAVEQLAKTVGLEIPRQNSTTPNKKENFQELYALANQAAKYYETELRASERAIEYLKNRGVSGKIAKAFQIGFAPPGWDHIIKHFSKDDETKQLLSSIGLTIQKEEGGYYDRFRDRIIFPIHDRHGKIIGFGGRIIDQGEPKYLNSPETSIFQKGHELYGLYQTLQIHRPLHRVLIVEGYMDVIALFQHDVTYAVATLGTATTAHHIQRLNRYTSEIIFCFDGDQAGRTAAWRALTVIFPLMRDDVTVKFMFLPDGEDPDSLIRKEGKAQFEKRIQSANTLSEFFFQSILQQTDIQKPDGRARFVKLAMEHLQSLADGIFKTIMLEELAQKVRVSIDELAPYKESKQSMFHDSREIQLKRSHSSKKQSPSPIRQALTLLLQNPELVQYTPESLPQLQIAGYDLFTELVALLKKDPQLNTVGIIEYYRDHKERPILSKLAHTNLLMPEAGMKNEFLGIIKTFQKMARKQTIESLISRAAIQGLKDEEKLQLKALIEEKNTG